MVQLFCTTYINADLAHYEILRAKVGKGGINIHMFLQRMFLLCGVPSYNFKNIIKHESISVAFLFLDATGFNL